MEPHELTKDDWITYWWRLPNGQAGTGGGRFDGLTAWENGKVTIDVVWPDVDNTGMSTLIDYVIRIEACSPEHGNENLLVTHAAERARRRPSDPLDSHARSYIVQVAQDVACQRERDLTTAKGADGEDLIAAIDLEQQLAAAHYDVRRIAFENDRRGPRAPGPNHRQVALTGSQLSDPPDVHWAVLVEGLVVDLTRRSIDEHADVPTIYESIDDAGRDWQLVWEDLVGTHKRELAAPAPTAP